VLAMVFIIALLTPMIGMSAQAVSRSDISKLQNSAGSLSEKRKSIQSKLDALSDSKSSALEKKELLDEKISVLSDQITNVEDQISEYSTLIAQTEKELAETEAKEKAQQELFNERVRAMEERGTISYWSVLFKASNFTDLLSRLDFINEIMDSDQSVIDQLQQLQDEIQAKKTSLESDKKSSESAKSDLVDKKTDLASQRQAACDLVAQIEQDSSDYQDTLDAISAEEDEIQAKIVKMSEELAAQQAAAAAKKRASSGTSGGSSGGGGGGGYYSGGSSSEVSSGGYIWPVSSHTISSGFGYRSSSSTGGVGSTNHKGIDISGVGYGSPVCASKAGTVIVAQYSSSYGNYVVISHGSGNTTLYAHMNSLAVSSGTYVSQGTVVGYTGATGHATGPHLHFEITINGSRVNPANYLP
jgi:murein DD-endopeptidase MepM/ murein hydrolase activator NlpD